MTIVLFIAGLVALVGGAELLVRGASRIASALGISPLVVGLTVVAFGTSSPELAVSVGAAFNGQADIAVGNVVGSNIFNVLFILGLSALIAPLVVAQQLIRLDVPLMIGCSLLLLVFALDGTVGRAEGALLFAGIVAYTGFLVWQSRRETDPAVVAEYAEAYPASAARRWLLDGGLIVIGLGLLVVGADWLVGAAVTFARQLGVSELVIGLTVVAAGTSLPEVAASVVAALKGEHVVDAAADDVADRDVGRARHRGRQRRRQQHLQRARGARRDRAGVAGRHRGRAVGAELRPAGDDRGVRRLPADFLHRPSRRSLGRRGVPWVLCVLYRIRGDESDRTRPARAVQPGDGCVRGAHHGADPCGGCIPRLARARRRATLTRPTGS
jgi:K+-dependent Na+/Ca+ exchanger-like protein